MSLDGRFLYKGRDVAALRKRELRALRRERKDAGYKLLNYVGLPKEYALRFLHEFSGGQELRRRL